MDELEGFLRSGRAADLILLIVILEGALLWILRRRTPAQARVPAARWLSPLLAGAALVLALRFALTGAGSGPIALALLVAGVAHLAGYRARWQP